MVEALAATVVIPALNEAQWIRDCIDSIRAGDRQDIEIVVIDGCSTDATPEIVRAISAQDERVRLVQNPGRTAASSMNVGLKEMATEILVRADAHAVYAPDFVRRNLEVLEQSGATVVGGPMVPVGTTRFGRAVAAVTTTRIGMGNGAFHWADRPRSVDTVYLGCYRRTDLEAVGGWDDEGLQRAAEDQEINFRIRRGGGRIVCDPSIRSWYYPRDTPRALWKQYLNYGLCKASTSKKHGRPPTVRSIVPAMFVAGTVVGFGTSITLRKVWPLTPAVAWTVVVSTAAHRLARAPGVDRPRAFLALAICHVGHGVGFLRGLGRIALGSEFDTGPGVGHVGPNPG